ncbi:Pseudouridine synthase family protein [Perilla frutescens var. hirtella]|nr:Pseudouridine synthase family protein [Perilla frutescens var. hirtella]KAH6785029.1 hypothetical protein C2S51_037484 [Perilla frutescens var. frutescens]
MLTLSDAPLRGFLAGKFQRTGCLAAGAKPPSRLFCSLPLTVANLTGPPPLEIPVAEGPEDLSDEREYIGRLPSPGYKWRLVISYDGTRFSGWQYQTSTPTVQCVLEEALTRITKLERNHLCLIGSGRTDAGVHAWGQVAHFITPFNYDCLAGIHRALNGLLPPDIRIREVRSVPPEFHARFSVTSKIYNYKIYNDTIMDPFQRHCVYHSAYKLNPEAMRDAAKHFVGKHDFSAFANASRNDRPPNPVKNIFRFDVIEMGPILHLEVEGSGFLYRQVRNMVALLLQVGREAVPPDIVPRILASRDRKELARYTLLVPPHGLCLFTVNYNDDHLRLPSGRPATSSGMHHTISRCKLPYF